jgi:hypothetical protein
MGQITLEPVELICGEIEVFVFDGHAEPLRPFKLIRLRLAVIHSILRCYAALSGTDREATSHHRHGE